MGLGSRTGAQHQTAALSAIAVRSEDYYDFRPGQRVMTVDGYPGTVTAVQDGPVPGNEAYEVTLDAGMGGGLYSTGQLRPESRTQASAQASTVQTAAVDYPELQEILESRPDIAPDKVASKVAHMGGNPPKFQPGDRVMSFRDEPATVHRVFPSDIPGKSHKVQVTWDDPQMNGSQRRHEDDRKKWPTLGNDPYTGPGDQTTYYEGVFEHHPDAVADVGRHLDEQMGAQPGIDFLDTNPHGPSHYSSYTAAEQDPGHGPVVDEAINQDPLEDYTAAVSWTDAHEPDGEWRPGNENDYASHVRCPNCDSNRALVSSDGTTTCQDCGYNTVGKTAKVSYDDCPECQAHHNALEGVYETAEEGPAWERFMTHVRSAHPKVPAKQWATCRDCGLTSTNNSGACPLCGGQMNASADTPSARTAAADYRFLTIAGQDPDFRWHVTASWSDVRAKAKRLRTEGRVRIVAAHGGVVSGEVKGDHHVYQTSLLKVPASHAVASWECGCKWAAYSWGRSAPYRRFEGRMCSHALAMQYEAQSRGMFGRTIDEDEKAPAWLRPRTRVVVEYDRDDKSNISRPAQPRKKDVGRVFSVCHEGLGLGATGSVVGSLTRYALRDGDDTTEVQLALHVVGIDGFPFIKAAVQERLAAPRNAPGNHPFASPVSADTGRYKMCSFCHGQGCDHCGWDGLVNEHSAALQQTAGQTGHLQGDHWFLNGVHRPEDCTACGGRDHTVESGHDYYGGVHHPEECAGCHTAAANDPFNEFGHDEDVTPGHVDNGNPGSSGWASGPDPWFGQDERGLHGIGIDAMSALDENGWNTERREGYPLAEHECSHTNWSPEGRCEDCGYSAGDNDSSVDQFGLGSYEPSYTYMPDKAPRGDATHYAPFEPDMDRLHSLNTLNADPEPALPQTDGEIDDDEGTPSTPSHPIAAARTEDDIVAAFQRQASHLDPGQSGGPASSDIAQAAKAHLAKTALKDFTPAEQQALISEGATDEVGAGNLASLDLSGTHYEQVEAMLAMSDDDDEGWLA